MPTTTTTFTIHRLDKSMLQMKACRCVECPYQKKQANIQTTGEVTVLHNELKHHHPSTGQKSPPDDGMHV